MNRPESPDHRLYHLLLVGFVVRLGIFFFAQNYGGDAVLRTWIGQRWMDDPYIVTHADQVTWVFAPLHFYLVGLSLAIWDNVMHSPRILSLVFGTLTIIPFFKLSEEVFSRKAAFYATLAFCFYTLHVRYSAIASSEAVHSFLILTAIWLHYRFLNAGRMSHLVLSAIVMNLATMIRYESLLAVPLMGLICLLNRRPESWHPRELFRVDFSRIRAAAVFCAIASLFIISRFFGDYLYNDNFLYSIGVSESHFAALQEAGLEQRGPLVHFLYCVTYWPGVTILSFTPLVGLIAFIGLFRSVRGKRGYDFALFALLYWFVYTWQTAVSHTLTTNARYSLLFGLLLMPFFGVQWSELLERLKPALRRISNAVLMASISGFFLFYILFGIEGEGVVQDKLSSISPVSRLPSYTQAVIDWIDTNTTAEETVVVDRYRFDNDYIDFYSRRRGDRLVTEWGDNSEILEYIRRQFPNYLVYSPEGKIRAILPLNPGDSVQTMAGITFRERYQVPHYVIYELTYDWTDSATVERLMKPT